MRVTASLLMVADLPTRSAIWSIELESCSVALEMTTTLPLAPGPAAQAEESVGLEACARGRSAHCSRRSASCSGSASSSG